MIERARTADPENTLLWRQNRRRLDGEAIRDALLAVIGPFEPRDGRPFGFSRASPGAEAAQQQRSRLAGLAEGRGSPSAAAFMSLSGATCGFRSSKSSTDPTPTRAVPAGRSRRSLPRRSVCSIVSWLMTRPELSPPAFDREAGSHANSQVMQVSSDRIRPSRRTQAERQMIHEFLGRGGSLDHLCLALLNTNAFIYID